MTSVNVAYRRHLTASGMQPDRFRQSAPETLVAERASNWEAFVPAAVGKVRRPRQGRQHYQSDVNASSKPEYRRCVLLFDTAIRSAFRCPMSTTKFFPRVTPV